MEVPDTVDNDCDGLVDEDDCLVDTPWRTETFVMDPLADLPARLIEGDAEFGGFGPAVDVFIQVIDERSRVDLYVFVEFTETAYNWSRGRVDTLFSTVYEPPEGCEIGALLDTMGGSDSSWQPDAPGTPAA